MPPGEDEDLQYLDLVDYLLIAEAITGTPAEVLARMDRLTAQAESALGAPQAGFGGTEVYRGLSTKAAILCSRLCRNHPLPDGNKRAAYVSMLEFVERNGGIFRMPEAEDPDEAVAMVIEALAAGTMDEQEFILWVAGLVDNRR